MLDPAIITFLTERKDAWLKKKMKASMSEEEISQIEEEADKLFSPEVWIPDAARRAKQLNLVTHPSKFTHSGAKGTSSIIASQLEPTSGLLCSGNVSLRDELATDITGNAAALDVYRFLRLILKDGRSILEHVRASTPQIQSQLTFESVSFKDLKDDFLKIESQDKQFKTHGKLKQVYFPVEDDYHLLSILTPSGILFELKHKIQNLRSSEHIKSGRQARKNSLEHEGFNEVFDVTEIGFGGTKPQNVSVLNNQNYGRAYLLPSLPPVMRREIRLPRKDFFHELLWHKQYQEEFQRFHKLLSLEINNFSIREGRNHWLEAIWDRVVQKAWEIRQHSEGWSEKEASQHLKSSQKIWLDDAYEIERSTQREWIQEVSEDFVRWFLWAYAKSLGSKSLSLGDDEVHAFSQLICKKEVSFL